MRPMHTRRQSRSKTWRWQPVLRAHDDGKRSDRADRLEPRPRAPIVVVVVCALGVGALLSYLWDPDRGRARRARLRDQSSAAVRQQRRRLTRAWTRRLRRMEGRLRGQWHRIPHFPGHDLPDDITLVEKIRSEVLGQPRFHGLPINVDSFDGVVHLRGELSEQARIEDSWPRPLASAGVRSVESFLHLPNQMAANKQDARLARTGDHCPPASN